jgi:hypothetical protein
VVPARQTRTRKVLVATTVLIAASACSSTSHAPREAAGTTTTAARGTPAASGAVAALSGPIEGGAHGFPFTSSALDLRTRGYTEREYFARGVAQAFRPSGTWNEDGRWAVRPSTKAPYRTRLLVRRPSDPDKFNGTVVVEWLNVSSGVDIDVDFGFEGEELLRAGYAWVGVSAQAAGVMSTHPGGGLSLGPKAVGLRAWDPARYGSLHHPGDAYSYDIFSQVGRALRMPGSVDPLGGLPVKTLLADGESQSAFRMVTYVNAVQPVARVYDGFLIHSRNGSAAPLADGYAGPVSAVHIRTDLAAPVFQVLTETDMFGIGASFPPARQPDTDRLRTWEVAGTAHADGTYLRLLYAQGTREISGMLDLTGIFATANNGPQRYVMHAALDALTAWVTRGTAPAHGEPLTIVDGKIARDRLGNALGGVRTPQLDVPTAVLSGEGLSIIGRTVPFDAATLRSLYPARSDYVRAFDRATERAVRAGHILATDVPEIEAAAARAGL